MRHTPSLLFVGASSCVGGSTVQGVGGFGFSFGGSGNGDDDPYERPADYKRLGGCSSDEGMYSVPVEEQPSDSSAKELVPGTDTNYVRARKVHMEAAAVKRDGSVESSRPRALPQYLPFQALGMSKQQANPNPYEYSGNSYEGEEWQGQGIVRGVRSNPPPPSPPPQFPQQVTSPHEVSSMITESAQRSADSYGLANEVLMLSSHIGDAKS